MICPKTLKGCPDDLCHGSGCVQLGGAEMLEQCHLCGGPIMDDMGGPTDGLVCEDCVESNEWEDFNEPAPSPVP